MRSQPSSTKTQHHHQVKTNNQIKDRIIQTVKTQMNRNLTRKITKSKKQIQILNKSQKIPKLVNLDT